MNASHPTPPVRKPPPKSRTGPFTRWVVIPLLLFCGGIEVGVQIERHHSRKSAAETENAQPVDTQAVVTPPPAPAVPTARPAISLTGEFQNNVYPSLILSFGATYPAYARCLALTVDNLPDAQGLQLRVDCPLFTQSLYAPVTNTERSASLTPDLPWNFDALRAMSQDTPETFVASLMDGDKVLAQQSLVCIVHGVNQVVFRVMKPGTTTWQDTSICFAACVNENSSEIPTLLQEAIAHNYISSFTGYEFGATSVAQQMQAVWQTLAGKGLSYVNIATSSSVAPSVSTQNVRSVEQSLHDQGANCVDASVLLASVFRKIGLRPVLLFRPGHCFVAVYDSPEGGQLIALETTLLNTGGFTKALASGNEELQTTLPYLGQPDYSQVDITYARAQGITPIGSP